MHKIIEDSTKHQQQIDFLDQAYNSTNHDDSFESACDSGPNVLDNYELKNTNYTKGIEITQCTFNGTNHFSIWDFSGYEPYHLFYSQFLHDSNASIHLIVYNLNQSHQECFNECVYWLEFLRSRINKNNNKTNNYYLNSIKLILIGTHADLDKTCSIRKEDGQYYSEKATSLKQILENFYSNDDLFDFSEKHFVLDARAACVTDTKLLIQHLIKLKQIICERLPKCTMFLNRTLFHLQNWRKKTLTNLSNSLSTSTYSLNSLTSTAMTTNKQDPIITSKLFMDEIRRSINPLASDDHLNELIDQLSLMGELVCLNKNQLICYQPEWLCHLLLGDLFSYERYSCVKSNNLNGIYSLHELNEIFQNLTLNIDLIRDILVTFDLCAEWESEKTNELLYEFAALNFLSEPLPLAFHTVKNVTKSNLFYINGFQIKTSAFHLDKSFNSNNSFSNSNLSSSSMSSSMTSSCTSLNFITNNNNNNNNDKNPYFKSIDTSQLANLFFIIQVNLRYLTNKNYCIDIENLIDKNKQNHQSSSSSSSSPPTTKTIPLINSSSNKKKNYDSFTHLNGSLIDIDLYQTRYCSRIMRKTCHIECLLSLDHSHGQFIELRACAPELWREELFYFVQDLYSFIEHVIYKSCSNINLEKHYLNFKPVLIHPHNNANNTNLGVLTYEAVYSPRDLVYMQFKNKATVLNTKRNCETKFSHLIYCGSDVIEKNIIYGIDLPLELMNAYTRQMLCIYLDRKDPMGLDWSILAVVLGLQEILPKLDDLISNNANDSVVFSKTDYVLNEWCKLRQEQATIRNLLNKIADLGRKDVFDMMLSTINLFKYGICKDSGIQNSNQTLASIK